MKNVLICLLLAATTALLILRWQEPEKVETSPVLPKDIETPPVPEPQPLYPGLMDALRQARATATLSAAVIGFCLLDERGDVVFEDQSRLSFIPASTLKTLTTATVLEKWGPDFRIATELKSTVPRLNGTLAGDVVIRGGADPMLSLTDLESWAQTLYEQGLRRIKGRIIGDGRLLRGSLYDDFWNWGDIGNGYGSGVSGLNLEHNRYTARFRPGTAEGMKATFLGVDREVPGARWINEVTTGAADSGDGVVIHGGERTGTLHLRGTVPPGGRDFQVSGAVPDPELYAAHHLRQALINAGIVVGGAAVSAEQLVQSDRSVPEAKEVLIKHVSPSLIEIITGIHAASDNHETECLYHLLGLNEKKSPDVAVREHWKTRGLVFEGLRMEDGCGLARADFVRPLDLARLQHLAGKGPYGSLYRQSLHSTEGGRLRWKGGAMSGVRSYTGFAKAVSGTEFTFALMVNHFSESGEISVLFRAILSAVQAM